MYRLTSSLVLYSDLPEDSVLRQLSDIYVDWESGRATPAVLTHRIYSQVKRLLDLSTTYGFDGNLWQNYLSFVMVNHLNSFSLCCEQRGALEDLAKALDSGNFPETRAFEDRLKTFYSRRDKLQKG